MLAAGIVLKGPVMEILDDTGALSKIEEGVHHLAEGIPILMNGLDAAAQLHPFIAGMFLCRKTRMNN